LLYFFYKNYILNINIVSLGVVSMEGLEEEYGEDVYNDEYLAEKVREGEIEAEDEGFMVGYNNS